MARPLPPPLLLLQQLRVRTSFRVQLCLERLDPPREMGAALVGCGELLHEHLGGRRRGGRWRDDPLTAVDPAAAARSVPRPQLSLLLHH
eukprot:COSAG01_NODE_31961_length_588_cov_3.325153_1_plen_88_part_10